MRPGAASAGPILPAGALKSGYGCLSWGERLWGGLYCLPIIEQATELQQIEQHFKLQAQVSSLQISHSFTHFTWVLNEKLFHVEHDQKEQLSIELNGIWLCPEAAIAKGIPTAMKKLITAKQKA